MAAENTASVDDLLVQLMNMGFELEESEKALLAAKYNIQDALDWLLGEKRSSSSVVPPTLVLRKNLGSQFDSGGLVSEERNEPTQLMAASNSSSGGFVAQSSNEISSRLASSEVGRSQFEEKRRKEVVEVAKQEKLEKQKQRETVMKRIAEDREERRKHEETFQNPSSTPLPLAVDIETKNDEAAKCRTAQSECRGCVIQVRCADGRVVKQTFDPRQVLNDLWEELQRQNVECRNMVLFQPFPKHEFTEDDRTCSFEGLGLTPTGSLVLKLQSNSDGQNENIQSAEEPSLQSSSPHILPQPNLQNLDLDTEQILNSEQEDELSSLHSSHEDLGGGNDPTPQGISEAFQNFLSGHNFFTQNVNPTGNSFGENNWGRGQRLGGDDQFPSDPVQRFFEAQPQCVAADQYFSIPHGSFPEPLTSSPLLSPISSLNDLCTRLVVKQIMQRQCFAHFVLPAVVAESIIQHMIKERLLRPQHLQCFASCHLTRLQFDCFSLTTNDLLYSLRYHTFLQQLSLVSCPLINDAGLMVLKSLKRLQSLNLRGCSQITDNCFAIIGDLPVLTTLILEETKVTDAGLICYLSMHRPNLQVLNLNRTKVENGFLQSLTNSPSLRFLGLDRTNISSLSLIPILPFLEALSVQATMISNMELCHLTNFPSLHSLNIGEMPNVNGDFALHLIQNLRLKQLQLPSRLTTTDEGLGFISKMPLISLDLINYIHVGDPGIANLAALFSLKQLNLSNTKLTDDGLLLLKDLIYLEIFCLDRTAISDKGTFVFKEMTKLQELSLSSTGIRGRHLVEVLGHCPRLMKLNLSRTRITNKVLRGIALPNLILLNADGTRLNGGDFTDLFAACPRLKHVFARNLKPPKPFLQDDSD